MQIWPGRPYPLGATYDGAGVNFALFSEVADKVELCLIGDRGKETRVEMVETDAFVHHVYLPGRAAGPALRLPRARALRPGNGHRCNPAKLLLDPYAKAIEGQIDGDESLFSYKFTGASRRSTTPTASATRCCRWSSTRSSTGAATATPSTSTTTPSSTRRTSRASR